MYAHGKIYTITNGNLMRNSFRMINNKTLHFCDQVAPIGYNSKMYEGVIYSELLGKSYITIPREKTCEIYNVKELNGYRVIDMKMERNICIAMAEKKNKYYRFILIFDFDKRSYDTRVNKDVTFDAINFTVLARI